ncbi:hypothetical protein CC86DRAFT_263080, partial [Ophiobolus disseminans]
RRWYRLRFDHAKQQWVFLDWLELATQTRHDSLHNPSGYAYASASNTSASTASTANSAPPQQHRHDREGLAIQGSCNKVNPAQSTHFEQLDPSFYVREGSFFQLGRLFSVLFTESAGANTLKAVTHYNDAISRVRHNEFVHTQIRRFIVVKRRRDFCCTVPLFTYGEQGTKKPGVAPQEHAIANSYGKTPQLLPGEEKLIKHAICIVMNEGERPLSTATRISFGIQHPVQYDVKVKDLGYVHPDWMQTLIGYWTMEQGSDMRQAAEVTAEA